MATLDYHLALAVEVEGGWQAQCKCGWKGEIRPTEDDADDGIAHDKCWNPVKGR